MTKLPETELKTIELKQQFSEQKAQETLCKEMDRMRQKAGKMSLYKRIHLEMEEAEIEMNIQKAKEAQARKIAEVEQEQKLARDLADKKREEMVKSKIYQLLRENSHELRSVEQQLRRAYLKKELISQIQEKKAIKKEEKVKEYYDDLKLIETYNDKNREEIEERIRKKNLALEYKKGVTEQIKEIVERRRNLSPQRAMDYDITGNDRRPKIEKNKNCLRSEMDDFMKIKADLKENERKEVDKLNKYVADYLADKEKRVKQQEEIENRKKEEKDRVHKYLADNITTHMSGKSEKNEMNLILKQEQRQHSIWLAEKKEKELKIRRRDEMIKQNEMQLKIKRDEEKEEKERDRDQAKKLSENFQVFSKAEERKNYERRLMMIEYGKELKESIDRKNNIKNQQKTLMKNEYAQAIKLEQQRLANIKKEQDLIIGQHIENLQGFFSPEIAIKK